MINRKKEIDNYYGTSIVSHRDNMQREFNMATNKRLDNPESFKKKKGFFAKWFGRKEK